MVEQGRMAADELVGKLGPPPHTANVVPARIKGRFFSETRITAFRLCEVA
jgi:hypothetical protein